MTEQELVEAIRTRIVAPAKRIDMTTVDTPPLYAAASTTAVEAAEAQVGFNLPALLRRLYTEVGNGGFGPSAGLVGVERGHPDVNGRNISALYADLRAQGWPEGLLPLCDWGGGAWACVDPDTRIVTMDESGPTKTCYTLASWLEAWVSGVDLTAETFEFVDVFMTNPFTKKPMAVKRRGRAKGAFS
jgi:hypothetical protein